VKTVCCCAVDSELCHKFTQLLIDKKQVCLWLPFIGLLSQVCEQTDIVVIILIQCKWLCGCLISALTCFLQRPLAW